MKKSHIVMLLTFLLLIPATIYFGLRFSGRAYYVTSTLVMIETLVPFLLAFENRKPQARELVVIAVLSALAVAARVVIPIPNFKAIFAIIMLSGIAFGPETGFLVGAISAFASNFFYGQGPYTPWQMFAYGAGGLLAGFLFAKGRLPRKPVVMGVFGFLTTLLLVGPLMTVLKRGLPASGVSRHLLPVRLRVQHEAERKTGGYLQPVPAAAGGLLRPVLQQLSPFRRDGAETELHRQQPDGGKLRVRHGDGTAGGGSVHVAELPVPGGVQRQGAVPVRQGQPTAVAVSYNFAALYSENRPGGKKNQPGSEGHRPGKQSG